MRLPVLALAVIGALVVCAPAQTPMEVQPVKVLKPTGTLGSCSYSPTATEAPFFARLNSAEKTNDTAFGGGYTMHGKTGTYIAWFGIVRGITPAALALVRVYGNVTAETARVPEVAVEYIRVWPWLTFTFTDLAGEDHSNPRWQRYSGAKPSDEIYVPYPNENYYLNVLGDPADFGVNLKPE